jgi:putative nucleotidyltransferase with HDIG domain
MIEEERDTLVGRHIAAFRVGALIGRGAMGRVYAAEHAVLGRRVAIKVLESQFAADPGALKRFVEEARSVNSIRHPNIVDITDFGEFEGRPYFVMELLEGETLGGRLVKQRRQTPAAALRICVQVASALTAAHDQGVIHRDLKPDNIFLSNHPDFPDHVKVLDFGIAKLTRRAATTDESHATTQLGILLGTPLYMSPEQSLGDVIDHRTDVYALGVVLYEMVTGMSPFDRPSLTEILLAQVHDTPPAPRAIDPALPEALEALILRALAKLPNQRFSDMRQMRAALTACADALAAAPAPVPVFGKPKPALASVPKAPPPQTVAGAATAVLRVPPPEPRPPPEPESIDKDSRPRPALAGASLEAILPAKALDVIRTPGAGIAYTLREIILGRIAANRLVLPTLPRATNAALAALGKPDANLARVAETLEKDPLIAPQLLRVASSATYGALSVPTTVHQAVVRLGVVRLRTLLIELSVRRVFASPRQAFSDAFRGMWRHSVLVALLARRICKELGNPVDPEAIHLGGLLHDVGKPLVGVMLLEAEKQIGTNFKIDLETWIQIVGQSHREVAVALARKWQLSAELQHVISNANSYHPGAQATNIVTFANAIAKHAGKTVGPVDADQVELAIADGAEVLGIDWRIVHELRTTIDEYDATDDDQ